jgi:poly(3-hydroxybutyrate) depolymerase
MKHGVAFFLSVLTIGLTANAATVVNLGGVVSNKTGQPVANAIVTLVRQAMKDTTGIDGKYLFAKNTAVQLPAIVPQTEDISMSNGILQFTLSNSSPVTIEIFDVKGNLLKKEVLKSAAAGAYRFDIAKNCRATNLLVVKAAIGKREVSFPYMKLYSGNYSLNRSGAYASSIGDGLAQMAAVLDTLKVTATGFQTKTVTITSYENQQQNITLDSSNGGEGSIGCGKPLSAIKSGTYTITSSGLSRQYIIDIPANYDPNKPYRLIFGMHCYGSSMQGVVNEKFYSLKPLADNAKVSCIWVAPNGNGSGTPLWDKGQQDHTFFDDMLKLFKENLCVDTARVFSCGFSYGAMFTYSLSLSHQKQLRAAACYAPANWNIWLPTIIHEPIAFYSTTGTDDPNCKYIYDDAQKLGGKYCVLQHIEDNGCPIPATIPTATSGKHVTTEFPGCKEGYPVIFGSFQGQHACVVSDQGSNVNWIAKETWDFFMRF